MNDKPNPVNNPWYCDAQRRLLEAWERDATEAMAPGLLTTLEMFARPFDEVRREYEAELINHKNAITMDYSQPKVTIDLREYNDLKEMEEAYDKSDLLVYEKTLGAIVDLMPITTRDKFFNDLRRQDIQGTYIDMRNTGAEQSRCTLKRHDPK